MFLGPLCSIGNATEVCRCRMPIRPIHTERGFILMRLRFMVCNRTDDVRVRVASTNISNIYSVYSVRLFTEFLLVVFSLVLFALFEDPYFRIPNFRIFYGYLNFSLHYTQIIFEGNNLALLFVQE